MTQTRIRIALQKSGRMADESRRLLQKCGLHIAYSRDELFCRVTELPIDLLLVRDDDIPVFVNNGTCDLGIVGENVYEETSRTMPSFKTEILKRLGFARCRLSLAVPERGDIKTLEELNKKRIATTYPALLNAFLKERGLEAQPIYMNGSVEVAPRLKIADAICDIVSSGATLMANGLVELTPILRSEALLIRATGRTDPVKETIIERLLMRMKGTLDAEDSKYVMLHAPKDRIDEIVKLIPGSESPTILPLSMEDKVALHAVCHEAVFWETMECLRAAGASSILVLPIEKMMA